MPYLIDGHNLIGAVPGIDLADPDDEAKLVRLVTAFCARQRTQATIYFDRGIPGLPNPPDAGPVTIRFVRPPATADTAIVHHLERLGRQAPNWTVVSSDLAVAHAARRARARTIQSSEFALRLRPPGSAQEDPEKPDPPASPREIDNWEELFRQKKAGSRRK